MNLYDRDYRTLTPDEESALQSTQAAQRQQLGKLTLTRGSIRDYPRAARHHLSFFPNNYLDICELQEADRLKSRLAEFAALFQPNSTELDERRILTFIRETRSYFIVGSLLKTYRFEFGHHDAYLFPEFALGTSFKVDYLLVGKGSGGWGFVFVEFEAPSANSILKDGSFGEPFRKGIGQIEDWRSWLQANFSSFRESLEKHKSEGRDLPSDFFKLDMTRLHFIVFAGQRKHFNDKTYRLRRERKDVQLLHYDNLIDSAGQLIGESTY